MAFTRLAFGKRGRVHKYRHIAAIIDPHVIGLQTECNTCAKAQRQLVYFEHIYSTLRPLCATVQLTQSDLLSRVLHRIRRRPFATQITQAHAVPAPTIDWPLPVYVHRRLLGMEELPDPLRQLPVGNLAPDLRARVAICNREEEDMG